MDSLQQLVNSHVTLNDIQQAIKQVSLVESADEIDESRVKEAILKSGLIDKLTGIISGTFVNRLERDGRQMDEIDGSDARLAAQRPEQELVIKHGFKYLKLSIFNGRSFVGLNGGHDAAFQLAIYFNKQRQTTPEIPINPDSDPQINQKFVFQLDVCCIIKDLDTNLLVDLDCKVHVCLLRQVGGELALFGVSEFDWRNVLVYGTRHFFPIEITDICNPHVSVGILEAQLDLLSEAESFLSKDQAQYNIEKTTARALESERLFYSYSREWWQDYLGIRASHSQRLVKLFATYEDGKRKLVTQFLYPIQSSYIQTPQNAARFTSLIEKENVLPVGGNSSLEVWLHPNTVLSLCKGDVHDHAVLLCCFLLGFYLDAYVTIGTDKSDKAHMWVTTIGVDGAVVFWEPMSGHQFDHLDPRHHLSKVGCMFNQTAFYANIQPSDRIDRMDFDLENGLQWKSLSPEAIQKVNKPVFQGIEIQSFYSLDNRMIEQDIERTMAICIRDYRDSNILTTRWDSKLSHLLEQCLWSLESQALDSKKEQYPDYFQAGIKRAIPDGHTFKGFPCNFNHTKPHRIFSRMLELDAFKQILVTQGDQVRFVVKAKVFPYAERVSSCWVMLGVSYMHL